MGGRSWGGGGGGGGGVDACMCPSVHLLGFCRNSGLIFKGQETSDSVIIH